MTTMDRKPSGGFLPNWNNNSDHDEDDDDDDDGLLMDDSDHDDDNDSDSVDDDSSLGDGFFLGELPLPDTTQSTSTATTTTSTAAAATTSAAASATTGLQLPSFADQLAVKSRTVATTNTDKVNQPAATSTISATATSTITTSTTAVRSSMKKTSSYGELEEIGQNIPIDTSKSKYKTLKPPVTATAIGSAAGVVSKSTRMIHSGSSPSLLESTSTGTNCIKRSNSKVSFSNIEIRDYDVTVGIGSCQFGPPVNLDWQYTQQHSLRVDDYEQAVSSKGRRSLRQMHLPAYRRQQMLQKQSNASSQDIKRAEKEAQKTFQQRQRTKAFLPLAKLEDLVESATRKLTRLGQKQQKQTNKQTKKHANNSNSNSSHNYIHKSRSTGDLLDIDDSTLTVATTQPDRSLPLSLYG